MNTNKKLLILERSSSELQFKQDAGVYMLEGIFGEIDKKNRNNRIYTEEEYLPQIEALQAKIKSAKLLGELDHPQTFDVSLKNVSHVIEELTYDKDTKQVKGKIRLLDTEAGRQAKALVDAGVPLQISSRAAGTVESNGTVKIKQLFTYDLVADPGFENAELKRVNETYGFINENNLFIYEINNPNDSNDLLTIENKEQTTMAQSKFISVEDFNKYSKYLAEEMKSIKESIASLNSSESTTAEIENIKEYASYLATKLDESISYTNYLAENIDNNINYSEHVAEKLDQSIQFSEHIAQGVESIKNYTNYLAESYNEGVVSHENIIKYVNYLKENLEKVTEYTEYVAETINSNLLFETDGEEAGIPAEDIESELQDVTEPTIDAEGNETEHNGEAEDTSAELNKELADDGEDAAKDVLESYKSEIASKLDALIKKASVKKEPQPSFFKFVSESVKNDFNQLDKDSQQVVLDAIENKGFLTEGQIMALWTSALNPIAAGTPNVIAMMPAEYKDTWNKLSEAKKNQILAQAKYHKLDTPYQVNNFWQTRDLREVAPVMEKVQMINESKGEETKQLPYDTSDIASQLAKRFKK